MANPRFSIVIPTRNRPEFVRQALLYACAQHPDAEIIISDNFTDPRMSAKSALDMVASNRVKYLVPPTPLGMVDNWNFSLDHAAGEYVLFFTDKTFLLPGALMQLDGILCSIDAEILNWTADTYFPDVGNQPFMSGWYSRVSDGHRSSYYDPREALSFKGRGSVPREIMSSGDYVRGKICFGAYKRSLIQRMRGRFGRVFHPMAPDYTSMILALSEAKSAYDLGFSGAVQVITSLSNGSQVASSDVVAKEFLMSVDVFDDIIKNGIAPGVYSSISANVAYDYFWLRKKYHLDFDFNIKSWLSLAKSDVFDENRLWSSASEKKSQEDALIRACVEHDLPCSTEAGRNHPKESKKSNGLSKIKSYVKDRLMDLGAKRGLSFLGKYGIINGGPAESLEKAIKIYPR